MVPRDAFLGTASEAYMSHLVTVVTFADGSVSRGPDLWVAWPDGPAAEPLVTTTELLFAVAPNGVLDPELRRGLDDPEVMVLPDLGLPLRRGAGRKPTPGR